MNMIKAGAAAMALVLSCGAASAATFNFSGNSPDSTSKVFTDGGVTVTATGWRTTLAGLLGQQVRVRQSGPGGGLGVTSNGDSSGEIDGNQFVDVLLLTFNQIVGMASVTFSFAQFDDDWTIYVDDGSGFVQIADDSTDNPFYYNGNFRRIAFQADAPDDDFKVNAMTVTPVPLPAGAWLLLAGVGGLVAMRRKQKAA